VIQKSKHTYKYKSQSKEVYSPLKCLLDHVKCLTRQNHVLNLIKWSLNEWIL